MKKMFLFLIFIITIGSANKLAAQAGIAINTDGSAADGSAMMDVKATDKGMLVPRMTLAQRTTIANPATGLMVYQTDGTAGFYYNSGTPGTPVWASVSSNPGLILNAGSLQPNFTPNTCVFNLQSTARTQLVTIGTLPAFTSLAYSSAGLTITKLEAFASANATDNQVFTVIVGSSPGPFVSTYTNTAMTCTMSTGISSCTATGSIVIPPGTFFGISQAFTTTNTPAGWNLRVAIQAK